MLSEQCVEELAFRLEAHDQMKRWATKLRAGWANPIQHWSDGFITLPCNKGELDQSTVDAFLKSRWSIHLLPGDPIDTPDGEVWNSPFERVIVGPMKFVTSPDICYHASPASNINSIAERGIQRGIDAEQRTTQRDDSGYYMHVSFSQEDAIAWATNDKLLSRYHAGDFAVFAVNMNGIENATYRDPASKGKTGYIVNVNAIEPNRLIGEPLRI